MGQFTKVATKADVDKGCGKVVEVDGKQIALFNNEGSYFAVDNTCAHQGGPLGEGSLTDKIVTCPWHGWEFDITNGECQIDPSVKISKYAVKLEGDDILIDVE